MILNKIVKKVKPVNFCGLSIDTRTIKKGNLFEDNLKKVLKELDLAIKEDPPLTMKEGGFIKESFSDELHEFKLIEKTA